MIHVLCLRHFWTSDILERYVITESHSQVTKVNSLDGPKDCYLTTWELDSTLIYLSPELLIVSGVVTYSDRKFCIEQCLFYTSVCI